MKRLALCFCAALAASSVYSAEKLHLTFDKPQTLTLDKQKISIPAGQNGWLVRGQEGIHLPAESLIGKTGTVLVKYKLGARLEPKQSNRSVLTIRCHSRNRAAVYIGGDSKDMTYYVGDYDTKLYHQSPYPIEYDEEHSSAFVWSGNSLQIYQDGKLQVDGKLPLPFEHPDAIHLGPFKDGYTVTEPWGNDTWFKELIVCDHAMSSAEVAKASGITIQSAVDSNPGFLAVPKNPEKAPQIDGAVDEPFWNYAASLPVPRHFNSPNHSFKAPNGRFMLSADDKNLYLGLWYSIPAYNTITEGQLRTPDFEPEVWGTESFEFYLFLNGQQYRFGGNVAGGFTESDGKSKAWNAPWSYKSTYKMLINDSHVWQAEAAIPWSAFGLSGKPQGEIPFNFCRTWSFTAYSGGTSFNPEGDTYSIGTKSPKLRFVDNAPVAQMLDRNDPSRGNLAGKIQLASPAGGKVNCEIALLTADGASLPMTLFAKDYTMKPGEVQEIDVDSKISGNTYNMIRYTLKQDGKVMACSLTPFQLNEVYLEASPLFLSGQVNVNIQRDMAMRKFACEAMDLRLVAPDGKELYRAKVNADVMTIPFDAKKMPGGVYQLALAANGKNLVTADLNFPGFGEWAKVKYDQTVILPPFTPLAMKGKVCSVWGREYRFDKGIFPVSVKTQGAELFRSAPQLLANAAAAAPVRFAVKNAAKHRAEFTASLKHPAFTATAESFAEYDGIFYGKIRVKPTQTLKDLKLRFTLPAAEAKYLHAANGAMWGTKLTRAIPAGKTAFGFYPMVFVGREDRGISFFTETNQNWTGDKQSVWSIEKNGDTATVEVTLRAELEANKPFDFEFGLIAAPVKAHTSDFPIDEIGCNHTMMMRRPGRAPVNYVSVFSGYGMGLGRTFADLPSEAACQDKLLNAAQMKEREKSHTKLAAYMLARCLSDEYPEAAAYYDEWKNSPHAPLSSVEDGKNVLIYDFCPTTTGLDFFSWHLKRYIERSKVDAIYYDFGCFGSCSNSLHGCENRWPIFGMRELYRRTALLLYQSGVKEPLVLLHNTDCVEVPAFTFATHLLNGEHIRQASSNLLHDGKDIQDSYDMSMYACELSSLAFGFTNSVYNPADPLAPQFGGGKEPADLYRFRVTQAFLAATLPHGTIIAQNRSHYGILDKIVRIYEKFGVHNAQFIGYWDNPAQVSGSDSVKVSVYRHAREKRALAVISHIAKAHENQNFTVTFDAAKLGFTPRKAVDLLPADDPEYQELYTLRGSNHIDAVRAPLDLGDFGSKLSGINNGKLSMSLKYHTFAIVELTE